MPITISSSTSELRIPAQYTNFNSQVLPVPPTYRYRLRCELIIGQANYYFFFKALVISVGDMHRFPTQSTCGLKSDTHIGTTEQTLNGKKDAITESPHCLKYCPVTTFAPQRGFLLYSDNRSPDHFPCSPECPRPTRNEFSSQDHVERLSAYL